jgi:hypothetical protein
MGMLDFKRVGAPSIYSYEINNDVFIILFIIYYKCVAED